MLRDIPRVYLSVAGFAMLLSMLVSWNLMTFQRDSDMLTLNTATEVAVVDSLDLASRAYPGAFLLGADFEVNAWTTLASSYPVGSDVQFEYRFDNTDSRFGTDVPPSETSPLYTVGAREPVEGDAVFTNRSVSTVRVFVRVPGETLTDWTYRSTVHIDGVGERL